MHKIFLLILFISFNSYGNSEIKKKYPFYRQFRSGFNLAFGLASTITANKYKSEEGLDDSEKSVGDFLMGVGILRIIDGILFLSIESKTEEYLKKGYLEPTHSDYKKYLNLAAKQERKLRIYRGIVILANSIAFGSIYNSDPDKFDYALWPAIGMLVVGNYALWVKGPTERTLDELGKPKLSFNFNFHRVERATIPVLGLRLTF